MFKAKIKNLGKGLVYQLSSNWRSYKFVLKDKIIIEITPKGRKNKVPYLGPHFVMKAPEKIYGLPKIYNFLKENNLVDEFTFKLEEEILIRV
ncbi:MAG: hypothetical protein H8D97_00580 [Proteobacteria bacterium]|nr:hypothetical protein [Pseudomonadota bacterium]